MVKAIFTAEMRKTLKSMIGQKFISYECENSDGPTMTYGNFRINAEEGSFDISNETKDFSFFDAEEDVACFSCEKAEPGSEYVPGVITESRVVPVQEEIRSVAVITDMIDVNNGEYQITFDQALIVRTDSKVYMFSKEIWFSEMINISDSEDYDSIYPISSVIEDWNNEGEYMVTVKRTKEEL